MTLAGDNALSERFFICQDTTEEPLETGLRSYTGTVSADFEDLTAYNRFVNGTEAALVLTCTAGSNTLVATCNVRFDGKTPNVGDRGVIEQSLPFVCLGSTDAAAITVVITNSDATA